MVLFVDDMVLLVNGWTLMAIHYGMSQIINFIETSPTNQYALSESTCSEKYVRVTTI